MSVYCRYVFGVVGLVSGIVHRGRVIIIMCSARSAYIRDWFGNVRLVSVSVRRIRLKSGRAWRGWVIVGT